jgi:hypothetical protein
MYVHMYIHRYKQTFFVAILLPRHYHKGDIRQPDMAFVLLQESSHLRAGTGCSGPLYRNIITHNSVRCWVLTGYSSSYNSSGCTYHHRFKDQMCVHMYKQTCTYIYVFTSDHSKKLQMPVLGSLILQTTYVYVCR